MDELTREQVEEIVARWERTGILTEVDAWVVSLCQTALTAMRERDQLRRDLDYQTEARCQDSKDNTANFRTWKKTYHDPIVVERDELEQSESELCKANDDALAKLREVLGRRDIHGVYEGIVCLAEMKTERDALKKAVEEDGSQEFDDVAVAAFNGLAARHKAILGRELAEERDRQDAQWGGPAHDDQHDRTDWCDSPWGFKRFISRALDEAVWADMAVTDYGIAGHANNYEKSLVSLAALAIAAIQSSRRKRNV